MNPTEYLLDAIESRELRDPHVSTLVEQWQNAHGLIADGLMGPRTVRSLHEAVADESGVELHARALRIAINEIGNGEDPAMGNNRSERIYYYRKTDGTERPWNGNGPWCAAFVSSCFVRAAIDVGKALPFTTSRGAKALTESVRDAGRRCTYPEVGALICWHRSRLGAASRKGHVAVIAEVDKATDSIVTIDGNKNMPGEKFATVERFEHPAGRWRARLYLMATTAPRGSLPPKPVPLPLPPPPCDD